MTIPAELGAIGTVGVDGFNDIGMRSLLKQLQNSALNPQETEVKEGF